MGELTVKLHEDEWQRLPDSLKSLFNKLPNHARDEVLAGFPDTGAASGAVRVNKAKTQFGFGDGKEEGRLSTGPTDDGGSAARFFYSAKAGPLDRLGTAHATVKPVDLMRWLVRMVTPPGGHILEPFAGSGTTGIAAMAEGFDCTMVELMADHCIDIERKLAFLRGEGGLRAMEMHKAKLDREISKKNEGLLL